MATSLAQFVRHLTESGLMSADDITAIQSRLPEEKRRPDDAQEFARELVRQKKLTPYQATLIYQGKPNGLIFGNYVVLDKLGQGGMGTVYKARHQRMGRIVALKVISPAVTKDQNALKRFQREVVAAAKLNHPNIVGAFDADEHKGTHFLVMEFVDGSDLAALVKQHGPFPIVQAVECIAQAACGLEFAHQEGVVHRDIKPHNLLLARESSKSEGRAGGVVKILDMGLARIDNSLSGSSGGESASLTQSGTIMGTVDYMSPEQALDTKHADHRADIYSLGITLWYLLTGKPCYDGSTLMKKLLAHREQPIPSLQATRGDVPQGLEAVFQRMVAKRPEDRYQSMTEVLAALRTCLTASAQIGQLVPSAPAATEDGDLMSFFRGIASETVAARPAAKIAKSVASDTQMPVTQGHTPTPLANTPPATIGQARRKQQMLIGGGLAVVAVLCLAGWWISRTGSDKTVTAAKPASEDVGFEVDTQSGKKREGKGRNSKTNALSSAGQFALKFDGKSFVEIPSLNWNGTDPVTLEFVVSVDAAEAAVAGTLVLASWPSLKPDEELLAYRISNLWAFDARHLTKRWISSINTVRTDERVLLTCIWDGKQTLVVANGDQGNAFEADANPVVGRPGLWIGGSDGHAKANQLFRGTIEQVRISKGVRTALTGVPKGKLPKDKSTIALYHFDEGRGSVLKDSSGNNHHGKIAGAKWVKSEQAIGSDYALQFDGDDRVTIEVLPEYSTESLTIEAYTQPESAKSDAWIYSLGSNGGLGTYRTDRKWRFGVVLDPFGWFQRLSPEPIELKRRVHLAGVCDKSEFRLYVDGKLTGLPASTVDQRFRGRQSTPLIGYGFHGIIDELRVSKVARYSKNFTPLSRHEPDANTFALYHFDEGNGEVLRDSSSNGHHGKIVGAKWVQVDGSAMSSNDPERAVAEWIINNGGDVVVVGKAGRIKKVSDLPPQPCAVSEVWCRNLPNFSEADAQRLTGLRELTRVEFWATTLSGGAIRTLAGCRRLQTLLVTGGSTTDATLSETLNISQLRMVQFNNLTVTDEFVACLGQLPQLDFVQLYGCKLISDEGLGRMAAAPPPKLKTLILRDTKVGASGLTAIARLPHLQELSLSNTQLDDAALVELALCPSLARVSLFDTPVTQVGTTELQKALAGCQILVRKPEQATPLYGPAYRDTIRRLMARGFGIMVTTNTAGGATWIRGDEPFPKGDVVFAEAASASYSDSAVVAETVDLQLLAQLSDLRSLVLTKLPLDGLRELLPLKNLTSLQISSPLTDPDIALLPSFPKLSTLRVTVPSDAALETIVKLPHLSYLIIPIESKITDNGLKTLESALVLSNVDLGYTNISLAAAQSLANARPDIIVTAKDQRLDPVELKPNAQAPPKKPNP
jgi:serine/threonine protein kinase